jgi:hypothetical protein
MGTSCLLLITDLKLITVLAQMINDELYFWSFFGKGMKGPIS